MTPTNVILLDDERRTDFLSKSNMPQSRVEKPNRFSLIARNAAFLLEEDMKFTKKMSPWNKGKKGLQVAWNKGKKFPQLSGENHPNFIDLKGKQFGSLLVMSFYGVNKTRGSLWMCQCICGRRLTINSSNLIRGMTHSCGCLKGKFISKSKFKHGMTNTPTYRSWSGMISRCYNSKEGSYKYYGAKGIKVCDRWLNSFINFLDDMGKSKKGMSIDRIDSKKSYYPDNCRWLTKQENARRAMMEKYHGNS